MSEKLQAKLQYAVDLAKVPNECVSLMLRAHNLSETNRLIEQLEREIGGDFNFVYGHSACKRRISEAIQMLEKYRDQLMILDQRATEVTNMLNGILKLEKDSNNEQESYATEVVSREKDGD